MKVKCVIEFSPDGTPVSDFAAEDLAKTLIDNFAYFKASTSNIFDATRALVARGEVSHEYVEFLFEGNSMVIDKAGRLGVWPKGFCGHTEVWLKDMISGRIRRDV